MTELEEIAAQIEEHKRQCYESGDPVQIFLADHYDEIQDEAFNIYVEDFFASIYVGKSPENSTAYTVVQDGHQESA